MRWKIIADNGIVKFMQFPETKEATTGEGVEAARSNDEKFCRRFYLLSGMLSMLTLPNKQYPSSHVWLVLKVWSFANLWQRFQSVKHLTSSLSGPHLIYWHFIFFHYNIFEKKNILESWHSPIYLRECQSHWYICSSLGLLRSERQEEGDMWMFKYFKVQRTFYQRGFNINIKGKLEQEKYL